MVNPVYLFCDDCLLSILTDDEGSWAKDDLGRKLSRVYKEFAYAIQDNPYLNKKRPHHLDKVFL